MTLSKTSQDDAALASLLSSAITTNNSPAKEKPLKTSAVVADAIASIPSSKARVAQLHKIREDRKEASAPLNRTSENLLHALNESLVDRELQLKAEKKTPMLPQRKMTCRLLDEVPTGPGAAQRLFSYVAQAHERQVLGGELNAKKKTVAVEAGSRRKKAKRSKERAKGQAYKDKQRAKLKQSRRRKGKRLALY